MGELVLMRGVPGSGKSRYVAKHFPGALVLCTDDALTDAHGVWKFDVARVPAIHAELLRVAKDAMLDGVPLVVVDKCNITMSAMGPFLRAALARRVSVRIVTLSVDPLTAYSRCSHDVPARAIARMAKRLRLETRRIPRWVKTQSG